MTSKNSTFLKKSVSDTKEASQANFPNINKHHSSKNRSEEGQGSASIIKNIHSKQREDSSEKPKTKGVIQSTKKISKIESDKGSKKKSSQRKRSSRKSLSNTLILEFIENLEDDLDLGDLEDLESEFSIDLEVEDGRTLNKPRPVLALSNRVKKTTAGMNFPHEPLRVACLLQWYQDNLGTTWTDVRSQVVARLVLEFYLEKSVWAWRLLFKRKGFTCIYEGIALPEIRNEVRDLGYVDLDELFNNDAIAFCRQIDEKRYAHCLSPVDKMRELCVKDLVYHMIQGHEMDRVITKVEWN